MTKGVTKPMTWDLGRHASRAASTLAHRFGLACQFSNPFRTHPSLTQSLILTFRALILLQKYAVTFRREFDQICPIHAAIDAMKVPAGPRNRENTLFFSLLAGNPAAETGSQATASPTTHS